MSTNSKTSPLVILIIAVVIIFIAAIIYRNLNIDNSEVVNIPKLTTENSSKNLNNNKKEYDFSPSADIPVSSEPVEDIYAHLSKEERDKKIASNLNKFTLYRTPEQVMEVIYQLKEVGKDEEAEEYIDFLIKRFPDYEMQ